MTSVQVAEWVRGHPWRVEDGLDPPESLCIKPEGEYDAPPGEAGHEEPTVDADTPAAEGCGGDAGDTARESEPTDAHDDGEAGGAHEAPAGEVAAQDSPAGGDEARRASAGGEREVDSGAPQDVETPREDATTEQHPVVADDAEGAEGSDGDVAVPDGNNDDDDGHGTPSQEDPHVEGEADGVPDDLLVPAAEAGGDVDDPVTPGGEEEEEEAPQEHAEADTADEEPAPPTEPAGTTGDDADAGVAEAEAEAEVEEPTAAAAAGVGGDEEDARDEEEAPTDEPQEVTPATEVEASAELETSGAEGGAPDDNVPPSVGDTPDDDAPSVDEARKVSIVQVEEDGGHDGNARGSDAHLTARPRQSVTVHSVYDGDRHEDDLADED